MKLKTFHTGLPEFPKGLPPPPVRHGRGNKIPFWAIPQGE